MTPTFLKAFKEVLREQILSNNEIDIEGLGNFEVIHVKQHQKKFGDGRVVMMPPADLVEFKSDLRSSHENQ
ncbi:MAG: HU family DNA-binding protein [Balneolaceae bacterium]